MKRKIRQYISGGYSSWRRSVIKICISRNIISDDKNLGPHFMKDYFDSGMSPKDAVDEDMSYA